MAITQKINTPFGVEIENAYCKITSIQIVNKTNMDFVVNWFVNNKEPNYIQSKSYFCQYDLDSSNPIKQAYEYLKTLPEFSGTVDC